MHSYGLWSRKKVGEINANRHANHLHPQKTHLRPPRRQFFFAHMFIAMRTFAASTIAALATLRADAFGVRTGVHRSALQVTAHHSFCSAASASSVAASSSSRQLWARHIKRPRAGGSTGREAAASLSMFDATDLFQLQQWAGDISATEVKKNTTLLCCPSLLVDGIIRSLRNVSWLLDIRSVLHQAACVLCPVP